MPDATPGVVEKACATCGSNGSQTLMFTELAKAAVENRKIVRRGTLTMVGIEVPFTRTLRTRWVPERSRRTIAA